MASVRLREAFPTEFRFFLNRYFGDWQRANSPDMRWPSRSNFLPPNVNIFAVTRILQNYFRRA